ncbi:MAG: MBL fold metallo-hydrolase, partial [Nitrospinaceae bacterium]|nr:MBL fold metallo-hydrolase [Nitrospinaceae bacterium]NIR54206.1 MBL fold metallo-hydrolase [Nitrospinaceae bacterium]NIS84621.1 MBL fold metallo-hydrolase [Nitrospinaceae bacterium]NIT81416.1 MBL fold metallo-hydrolase [Nitrospinaceae bacterium]NIU43700.1 MBL fold metallo-hydrolase [Nitrospinaceae bacterium]
MPVKARILFSHVHWDHIQGFPFFKPLYVKGNEFDIYAGTCLPTPIEEVLKQQMSPPCFPVKTDVLAARIKYHDIRPGDVIYGRNYRVT